MNNSRIVIADAIARVRKGEARALKAGGAWIYDNEIDCVEGTFENGDILRVQDFDGYPLGYGFINENSKIRIRMLSRYRKEPVDILFLQQRVEAAWEYRKAVMGDDLNCTRVIFGEADSLPGLVVDKYADVLVVESLAMGIDRLKGIIVEHLINLCKKDGIVINAVYERSDAPVRKKEGMQPFKGLLWKNKECEMSDDELMDYLTHIEIVENGVHYLVDVINGQKTGFFLDQKFNRRAMQRLCKNLASGAGDSKIRVLDCFTHMGTFALNCGLALGEKGDVTGLDISEYAVEQATANSARNNLTEVVKFRAANVLDELPKLGAAGEMFDVVILDPPAFTKSREATKNAIKGYREINMKGMRLVKDGGYFATCSCSHFMTQELFTKTIAEAAKAVHKRLRQIEFNTQAPDHPILWSADESYYLKFYIFQVVDEK